MAPIMYLSECYIYIYMQNMCDKTHEFCGEGCKSRCELLLGKAGALVVLALTEQRTRPSILIKPNKPLTSPSWASAMGAAAMATTIRETKRSELDLKAMAITS